MVSKEYITPIIVGTATLLLLIILLIVLFYDSKPKESRNTTNPEIVRDIPTLLRDDTPSHNNIVGSLSQHRNNDGEGSSQRGDSEALLEDDEVRNINFNSDSEVDRTSRPVTPTFPRRGARRMARRE